MAPVAWSRTTTRSFTGFWVHINCFRVEPSLRGGIVIGFRKQRQLEVILDALEDTAVFTKLGEDHVELGFPASVLVFKMDFLRIELHDHFLVQPSNHSSGFEERLRVTPIPDLSNMPFAASRKAVSESFDSGSFVAK